MTVANEYGLLEEGQGEEQSGATIFGLKLTPKIIGIVIGVVGIGLAGYLYTQFVQLEAQKRDELNAKITEAEGKIQKPEVLQRQKAEAQQNLAIAQQRRAEVTTMFADDATLDTLLFDLNQLIGRINTGIQGDDRKAQLTKFDPVMPTPAPGTKPGGSVSPVEVVTDSSLGPGVNGQLRRKQYKVEFVGDFAQTQAFLRSLELMQSLLVVKNLKSQLAESTQKIEVDLQQGKLIPIGQPQTKIKTSFDLQALLPLKPEDQTASNATSSPAPSGSQPTGAK